MRELVQRAVGLSGREPEDSVRARLLESLRRAEDAELVADLIAGVLGGEPRAPAETFWGVRRLLETFAQERQLVVVLEDVHWAEPTLLDLVEYLVARTAAPVLLACVARPELLDRRHAWPVSGGPARTIAIEPLEDEESGRLASGLGVPDQAIERVVAAAEGNPLFLEEFARMVLDEELALETVPPTIQALLAARVDHLAAAERSVLQRAAVVEGRSPGARSWSSLPTRPVGAISRRSSARV